LLTRALEELGSSHADFERARQHNLSILKTGFDFGTQGKVSWKRNELHKC
jgi:hypothetical protein